MNPTIEKFLYLAEEQYLQAGEIKEYRAYLADLKEKIKIYEVIRDNEVHIFKILVDELQSRYPDERSSMIGEAICQWSLILKACCTALILDNPEYLEERIDNWFRELIQLRNPSDIDSILYTNLVEVLAEILSEMQVSRIKPMLERVKETSLMNSERKRLVEMR